MTHEPAPDVPTAPGAGSKVLRVAAVCFSLALFGGYLVYRSGGSPTPSTNPAGAAPTTAQTTADERTVMPSSKSGPVTPPSTQRGRRMMPGSKSAVLTEPVHDITRNDRQPATQPATTGPSVQLTLQPEGSGAPQPLPERGRRMMPGSKSSIVIERLDTSRLLETQPSTQPTTRPDLRLD